MIEGSSQPPAPQPTNDNAAMVALVLGVLSCACGFFTGIPALIVGGTALNKVSDKARPMAIIGMVLGGLSTLLGFIGLVMMLLGFSILGAATPDFEELEQMPDQGDEIENWDEEE